MPKRKRRREERLCDQGKIDRHLADHPEINVIFRVFPQHKTDLKGILDILLNNMSDSDHSLIFNLIVDFVMNDENVPDLSDIYLLLETLSGTGVFVRRYDVDSGLITHDYCTLLTLGNIQTILREYRSAIPNILEKLNQIKMPIDDRLQSVLDKILSDIKSTQFLGFLHPRVGARSPLNQLVRTSTMFEPRVTRLILDLAGATTTKRLIR